MQRIDKTTFLCTTFLSAFLLFQIQPLFAKIITPWFGGTPAVWTTCLLLFQSLLLAGYLYAYLLERFTTPSVRKVLHSTIILASALLLHCYPDDSWKPKDPSFPITRIILLLTAHIGLPYTILSSSAPLIQKWYYEKFKEENPYWLYALSNIGSLISLITYPILIEPFIAISLQTMIWSLGYLLYSCAIVVITIRLPKERVTASDEHRSPNPGELFLWLALPACGTALLMTITNHICHDVSPVPFLWIAPLTLYLLSFIFCFGSDSWYVRKRYMTVTIAGALLFFQGTLVSPAVPLILSIPLSLITLFSACMTCHGEVFAIRPHAKDLNLFYLLVSLGGALGGVFISVIAPTLFNDYYELPITFLTVCILIGWLITSDPTSRPYGSIEGTEPQELPSSPPSSRYRMGGVLLIVALIISLTFKHIGQNRNVLSKERSFYGVLTAIEKGEGNTLERLQIHGHIVHGSQFQDATRRTVPTQYYGPRSPIGQMIQAYRELRPLHVGVVGMGVGTLAAFGQSGERYDFFEINPSVIKQAENQFHYLADSKAQITIRPGDGRLSLETLPNQNFDILIIDAFSGDAIPTHLLTIEAFQIYQKHLARGGFLAVHTTNEHLNISRVVWSVGRARGLNIMELRGHFEKETNTAESDWLFLTSSQPPVTLPTSSLITQIPPPSSTITPWTDDFSNLLSILRF